MVGDDLSLYPQVRELTGMLNGPARFLPGNHDLDFDSTSSEHTFDTYRANLGPEYYSYDVGQAHVVALNTVEYPVGDPHAGTTSLDERQLEWLRNDIAQVPENRLIVLAAHIPLLDYADQGQHQAPGRAGHGGLRAARGPRGRRARRPHATASRTCAKATAWQGWSDVFGVDGLPFTHITAGAISGDWYSGPCSPRATRRALQRDGGQPGVLTLDINGTDVEERFTVRGEDDSRADGARPEHAPLPRVVRRSPSRTTRRGAGAHRPARRVAGRPGRNTWLTTNFWMGSTGSTVTATLDGGESVEAVRTQPMRGEAPLVGAE